MKLEHNLTVIPTVLALATPATQIDMPPLFPMSGIELQIKDTSTVLKPMFSMPKIKESIFRSEYIDTVDMLHSYLSLQHDWDGYGGKAPSFDLISAGEKLLIEFQRYSFKAPKLMLSGSDEIGFYWENENEYAEITCDNLELYTFIYMKDKVPFIEEDVNIKNAFSSDLITRISNINRSNV